jgi:hypothetical protein
MITAGLIKVSLCLNWKLIMLCANVDLDAVKSGVIPKDLNSLESVC